MRPAFLHGPAVLLPLLQLLLLQLLLVHGDDGLSISSLRGSAGDSPSATNPSAAHRRRPEPPGQTRRKKSAPLEEPKKSGLQSVEFEGGLGESVGAASGIVGEAGGSQDVPGIGALRRFSNAIRNSSLVERFISLLRYFVGPTPGRPEKTLLRKSDSAGIGVGVVLHVLQREDEQGREVLSRHLKADPEVRGFIQRFRELADPVRTVKESRARLLWVRRGCARLALGAYGADEQSQFLSLVKIFRQEFMHLLGFIALCLGNLPRSFEALTLLVDRLLVPLQEALRSVAAVSGHFTGFAVSLVQQQLLRWIERLARLDAALLKQVPGGSKALASLQSLTSMDWSVEDTDSRLSSAEDDKAPQDSHL